MPIKFRQGILMVVWIAMELCIKFILCAKRQLVCISQISTVKFGVF